MNQNTDDDRLPIRPERRDVLRSASLTALLTLTGTAATSPAGAEGPTTAASQTDASDPLSWYRTANKQGKDAFRDAIATNDDGVSTVGIATVDTGGKESWQYGWDAAGEQTFSRLHGAAGFDSTTGGTLTDRDGFVLCGQSTSGGSTTDRVYVVGTDGDGEESWTRRFHVRRCADDRAVDVAQTTDGGYVLTGSSGDRAMLAKLDSDGEATWTATYTGETALEPVAVAETDGGFVVAGTATGPDGRSLVLLGTTPTGTERWRETFTVGVESWATDCLETDDGFVVAGTTRGEDRFTTDALVVQTDRRGEPQWRVTYGREGSENTGNGITAVDDGFVFVGTRSVDVIGPQIWLAGIGATGEKRWADTFGTDRAETPYAITTTTGGDVALCGMRNPDERRDDYEGFVAKVDVSKLGA